MGNISSVTASDLLTILDLGEVVAELAQEAATLARNHGFELNDAWVNGAYGRARATLRVVAQAMFDWVGGRVYPQDNNGVFTIDLRNVSADDIAKSQAHKNGGLGDLQWLAEFGPRFGFPPARDLLVAYLHNYIKSEIGFRADRYPPTAAREFTAMANLLKGGK